MGREIREVPENWQHPKDESGAYIPLHNNTFQKDITEWLEGNEKWSQGLCRNYVSDKWESIPDDYKDDSYSEYTGSRPIQADYMPDFTESECTHIMMYETCTEGTPISTPFKSPEKLARWLSNNNASSFGAMTATYKQWLSMIQAGSAPSAVYSSGKLSSGVEEMHSIANKKAACT